MLKPFSIHEPSSSENASKLLNEFGWDGSIYAGGTELLVVMREGLADFPHLINIKKIPEIDSISVETDKKLIRIGAGTTHRSIETSTLIEQYAPLLAEVEKQVANIRVRNMGTIGGNLCFAEPHSDPATLFMAWEGALFELTSQDKARMVSPKDFSIDFMMTDRQEDEIMTAIILPFQKIEEGAAFQKFVTLERPTVNVACFLSINKNKIQTARISIGSVGPIPFRAIKAEEYLQGKQPSEEIFEEAGEIAANSSDPVNDIYGSEEYKKNLVKVVTKRTLKTAADEVQSIRK
jgi:aerobic carbon-monoxide dehydrogenase medium subunit